MRNDPLCASCNSRGECTSCFRNYVLIDGRCYHKGVLSKPEESRARSNPLCAEWNGDKCEKCVAGTYMNLDGECKIEDPNCQKFDYVNEVCKICMRGYTLEDYRCVRKY